MMILILAGLSVSRLAAADWPRWRGPHGDGHVLAPDKLPATLPPQPKVLWRKPVGFSLGSPVVSQGRLFHLDNQEGKETVHALDADTGRELWHRAIDSVFKDQQSPPGPRGTPTVDGDRVYVQSCQTEFQCLRAADGKLLWRLNFVRDLQAVFIGEKGTAIGASRHGYTASPWIEGDRIYISAGGTNGAGVVCLNKHTGKLIWKSQNDIPGHAGPLLTELAGVRQLVCFTAEALIGLRESDGRLLWRYPIKTRLGRHAITPVVVGNRGVAGSFQAGLICLEITRQGDTLEARPAWIERDLAMNFASPVAVGQFLYGLGPRKNILCADVQTGKLQWSQDSLLQTSGWRAYASLVADQDKLLVLTDQGLLALIAADPAAYRELARTQACGKNWCSPAYADGRLYLRDERELKCIQLQP